MDLNELLYHHQRAIMRADPNRAGMAVGNGSDLVRHYAERIRRLRHQMGVTAWPAWAVPA